MRAARRGPDPGSGEHGGEHPRRDHGDHQHGERDGQRAHPRRRAALARREDRRRRLRVAPQRLARGRRARVGLGVLLAGVGVTAAGVLIARVPVAIGVAGWMLSGFGIGIAYPSIGALVLAQATPGEEGLVSAALQLAETVGVAVFTGVGGALIAVGLDRGWNDVAALAVVFAGAAGVTAAGLLAGRRTAVAA